MNYNLVIKTAFNILLKKDDLSGFKKVVKIVSDFFENPQMDTRPKRKRERESEKREQEKKKRKIEKEKKITKIFEKFSKKIHVPPELIIEIALHIPYKDLEGFMGIDKYLNLVLNNSNYFWWKKIKTEYKGFKYPKLLEDIVKDDESKYDWRELTQRLFSKLKVLIESFSNGFGFDDWIRSNQKIFRVGNELIIKELITYTIKNHLYFKIKKHFLREYFEINKVLDNFFLIYIINNYSNFNWIFRRLFSNKNFIDKIPDKSSFVIAYLKRSYNDYFYGGYTKISIFDEEMAPVISNLDLLYENGINLFFDENFIRKAIKINGYILIYLIKLNEDYASDEVIILEAIKTSNVGFKSINPILKKNEDFVLKALEINPFIFSFLPAKFTRDKDLVFRIMKKNKNIRGIGFIFYGMGYNLRKDKDIALYFVNFHGIKMEDVISYGIEDNLGFFYELIDFDNKNIREIYRAGEVVRGNMEFIKYAIEIFLKLDMREKGEYRNPIFQATRDLLAEFFINLENKDLRSYFESNYESIKRYIFFFDDPTKIIIPKEDIYKTFRNLEFLKDYVSDNKYYVQEFLSTISEKLI